MKKTLKTSAICLLGTFFATSTLGADANSFTGLGINLNLGMGSFLYKNKKDDNKTGREGGKFGLEAAYGFDVQSFYVGAAFGYQMPFYKKTRDFKYKSTLYGDLHLGAALNNFVLPTVFVGYGSEKVENLSGKKNNDGVRYGARITFKAMDNMTVGLGTSFSSLSTKVKGVKFKSSATHTAIHVGFHL